jgi:hypothetical protein
MTKWRKIQKRPASRLDEKWRKKIMKGRADRFYSSGGVHRAMKPLSVTQQEHGRES